MRPAPPVKSRRAASPFFSWKPGCRLGSGHHLKSCMPDLQLHYPSSANDPSVDRVSTLGVWQQTRKQSISEKNKKSEGTGRWPSLQLFMPSSETIVSAGHSMVIPSTFSYLIWKPRWLTQHSELPILKICLGEKSMKIPNFSSKYNTAK